MKVLYPGRILNRHVGGNTTYTRALVDGLQRREIPTAALAARSHPLATLLSETLDGCRLRGSGLVLHFTADTGPLFRTRCPSVVTIHGVASRWVSVARTPWQERVWRTRVARAISSTDAVITVTQSSANDITEVFGISRSEIHVIPHGVVPPIRDDQPLRPEIRRAMAEPYLLYLGNLEPRKNVLGLVHAMQQSPLKSCGYRLLIAGRLAWNYGAIVRAIDQAPNVTYLGFVSENERAALLQQTRLFVFPSFYEGFGLPVLEALAVGTPVASSHRGALAEVAGPAIPLNRLTAIDLADEIACILDDQSAMDGCATAGPSWAEQFSWETSIDAHLALYEKIAATR